MEVFTKNKSTKDAIIEILSSEWPLSLKKIHNAIKKKYAISVTYQATHKAINELVDGGTLKKENREYQLSFNWINRIESFGKKLREDYLKKDGFEAGKETEQKPDDEIKAYEDYCLQDSGKASSIVGFDDELKKLQGFMGGALKGHRQIIFVTGEPGIGKTTLVESFLKRIITKFYSTFFTTKISRSFDELITSPAFYFFDYGVYHLSFHFMSIYTGD